MTATEFKALVAASGLTQVQVAALLETTQGAVSKWIRGDRAISGPTAIAIEARLSGKVRGKVASRRSRKAA